MIFAQSAIFSSRAFRAFRAVCDFVFGGRAPRIGGSIGSGQIDRGLVKYQEVAHLRAKQTMSTFAELVADALLADPALLQTAQATNTHWRQLGAHGDKWLDCWDVLLADARASAQGMAHLQQVLRAPDAQSQRLREFAPLAGLLPREVRRKARDLCGYRH